MEPLPSALPAAPPVVAVVICTDPGAWFEECLSSLGDQDYPNLSVLVIDTASRVDPTPRVAAVLPRAFVRRSAATRYAVAANEVLGMVEGASLYLFCHDDVALSPDALRIMVEEAYRSNAGIVGPKLVEWEDPSRLLAVGAAADRFGVVHPLVEPGELDQEQHDAVRDVFLVPSAATLVRSDLFLALGGFDPVIDQVGDDLDLCWRAQVAGARVVVAPSARVRHLKAQMSQQRQGWESPEDTLRATGLAEAHRLRSALVCYGVLRLLWLIPFAGLSIVSETLIHLVRGRPGAARTSLGALHTAVRRPGSLWRSRRRVQRQRVLADREVHRLQSRGNARLRAFVRRGLGGDPLTAGLGSGEAAALVVGSEDDPHGLPLNEPLPSGPINAGRRGDFDPAPGGAPAPPLDAPAAGAASPRGAPGGALAVDHDSFTIGGVRATLVVAAVLVVVLIIGSRSLLGHDIPAVGQLPDSSGGIGSWWHQWWSAWRPQGLGSVGPGAPAVGVMALLATVLFGAVGTLQHVVVLGPLVVGPWGMWRVTKRLGSTRGRLVAAVVYAAVPVPYNALAEGRWGGLLMFAAAPWILGALSQASGEAPYLTVGSSRRRLLVDILRLGLLVALLGAFVPVATLVVPLIGLALYLGCALGGKAAAGRRGALVGVGAGAVAIGLLFPWSIRTFGSLSAVFGVSGGPASRLGLGQVLRFDTGPVGTGWLGWALLAAAALALVIGGSWRLAWAARWWTVALVGWALTWIGLRGWLPVPIADPEVLLAPAAAAMAMASGLGATAFERDLPSYNFGWRQLASAVAGVAVVVAALPMLRAAGDGRWHVPAAAPTSALALPGTDPASYRVLWVGAPAAIPGASWRLADGVGYATSIGSGTELSDLWLPGKAGSAGLLATVITLAERNETTQLGHLLAPMAVRYVVIPSATAPSGEGGHAVVVPSAVIAGLRYQTDLQPLIADPNYTIYQNMAWAPGATLLSAGASAAAAQAGPADSRARLRSLQSVDLSGSAPVLPGALSGSASGFSGAGTLYVAVGGTKQLHVAENGHDLSGRPAFGWASQFTLNGAGPLQLRVKAPAVLRLGQLLELLLVLAGAGVVAIDARRRRRAPPPPAAVDPEEEWGGALRPVRPSSLPRRPVAAPVGGFDEDLWADG